MSSKNTILLTDLLVQSISEEYDIDESKVKDFLKKTIGPVAVGTAAALSTLGPGKEIKSVSPRTNVRTDVSGKKEIQKPASHSEILLRQAYKESGFKPDAVSKKGAKGLTQIMPSALQDYMKRLKAKGIDRQIDLNNIKDAIDVQVSSMKNLYNASFINVPNQNETVRLAKTLAAYNWGRGNLSNFLNKAKEEGLDIYNSLDWTKKLPTETYDYINKILLKKDPKFEKNFKQATQDSPIVKYYKNIKGLNESKKIYA